MFEQLTSDDSVEETLALAAESRHVADAHEARILRLAAHYGDLHAVTRADIVAHVVPGMERMVRLGGVGTPDVAEFAPAELGAVLGISAAAGASLVGEALELRHRLPTLWALVHEGRLQAWKARLIAGKCLSLSQETVAYVDARIGPVAASIGPVRLVNLIEAAKVHTDPVQAAADAAAAAKRRGVWVSQSNEHGHKTITIHTDAGDVIRFDATLDRVADILGRLGDADPKEVRRAKAVGILASPEATLALFLDDRAVQAGADPADIANQNPFARPNDDTAAGPVVRRSDLLPQVTLYLHLNQDSFTRGADGVARFEGAGPITTHQAHQILRHANLTIRPVIDIEDRAVVDAYEVPDRDGRGGAPEEPLLHRAVLQPHRPPQGRRPHRPLRPTRRGRTTRPDRHPQTRGHLPTRPPPKNPRRLGRRTTVQRDLRLAITGRTHLHRRPHRHPGTHPHRLDLRPCDACLGRSGTSPGHGTSPSGTATTSSILNWFRETVSVGEVDHAGLPIVEG